MFLFREDTEIYSNARLVEKINNYLPIQKESNYEIKLD